METLEQYRARTANRNTLAENKNNAAHYFQRAERMVMFTVVEDSLAKEIEASARLRGAVKHCIANLDAFYTEWNADKDNEGKTLMVCLNDGEGSPFPGKKTDSLYTSFRNYIKDRTEEWRLIKSDGKLFIAHL